jgi:hypothetical protein
VTPSPTRSTIPAPSCPSRNGNASVPKTPFFAERSVWQTPLARMRTSASPGPGGSIVNSSTTPG